MIKKKKKDDIKGKFRIYYNNKPNPFCEFFLRLINSLRVLNFLRKRNKSSLSFQ